MSDQADQTRPRVIVTKQLPGTIEARMADLFDVSVNPDNHDFTRDELKAAVATCDVLVPTISDPIDADVIANAGPRLKLVANFGAGVDHVDQAALAQKGIRLTNTPGVLTEDTADMAMALLLAVPRRLTEGERLLRAGDWQGWAPTHLLGTRVGGKRLGIVGMGRIGRAVARRARAFGMAIHYHNRHPLPDTVETDLGARYWDNLDEMLAAMDFVSLNCPLTPETRGLMNADRIGKMQTHGILINTARGEVVDEAALASALKDGRLAGAGLDVYEQEPKVHPDLLALDNAVLAPHLASATTESRVAMGEKVLINIRAFVDGHTPPDRVLPPAD